MELRLRELMTERGVTQEKVSQATGIPQGTLSRWVGNKVDRYDKNILNKLIAYFNCEITDIVYVDREGAGSR